MVLVQIRVDFFPKLLAASIHWDDNRRNVNFDMFSDEKHYVFCSQRKYEWRRTLQLTNPCGSFWESKSSVPKTTNKISSSKVSVDSVICARKIYSEYCSMHSYSHSLTLANVCFWRLFLQSNSFSFKLLAGHEYISINISQDSFDFYKRDSEKNI